MAVDKLVDSTQLDTDLTSVANAIRTKGGTSAQLAFPAGFVQAIADIPSGGTDHLKTATVTLAQDYPAANTTGTTIKNLIDAAIGTDYWVAWVSGAPAGITEFAQVFLGGVKVTSMNVANLNGYDTTVMSSSTTSPSNAGFWRSYSTAYMQGLYPGTTNARAYSGMTYQIWGWDAS